MNKTELLNSLKRKGFSNKVLDAFSEVKRENFVSKDLKNRAYEDNALQIGEGQTISQPYTIATMLSLLDLKKGQKVLEIGSGCGYVLALMSEIVDKKGEVYGVEIKSELVEKSKENTKDYKNIQIYNKNGRQGFKEAAPFDRILISAASETIPKEVLSQLKDKGLVVAPVGPRDSQSLIAFQREKDEFKIKEKLPGFVFVPFV